MSCGFAFRLSSGESVPCGKCQGCLRRRRRAWVGRMLVEAAACGGDSSFVTLTYGDDALPMVYQPEIGDWIPTLEKSHAKNWLQSVRRKATGLGLPRRFFMAGEYGSKGGRPHYHVILFGIGPTYQSRFEGLWTHGFQSWYPASVRAMAYVAKYCLKHGKDPELDLLASCGSGSTEIPRVTVPPFRRLSRNPPIGGDLVKKVANALCMKGSPEQLLEAEKMLKGTIRVSGDQYPIDRTIKDALALTLSTDYGLDEVTIARMLKGESPEPTQRQSANARKAHQRAEQRKRSRHKL